VQAHPQKFDLAKIRAKSVEIRTKCVKIFAKSLGVLWFLKNGAQNKSADAFFLGGHFLVLFGEVREIWAILREIWVKMALEVLWFERNAPKIKLKAVDFCFLEVIFWSFSWASLGKFGQKSFAPPKICLLLHLWLIMLLKLI